jgi:hypothetical protein
MKRRQEAGDRTQEVGDKTKYHDALGTRTATVAPRWASWASSKLSTKGCFSRAPCTMARWTPLPRPWMRRTSVNPASWAAFTYSATTEGMSLGWNAWRSNEDSMGTRWATSSGYARTLCSVSCLRSPRKSPGRPSSGQSADTPGTVRRATASALRRRRAPEAPRRPQGARLCSRRTVSQQGTRRA